MVFERVVRWYKDDDRDSISNDIKLGHCEAWSGDKKVSIQMKEDQMIGLSFFSWHTL